MRKHFFLLLSWLFSVPLATLDSADVATTDNTQVALASKDDLSMQQTPLFGREDEPVDIFFSRATTIINFQKMVADIACCTTLRQRKDASAPLALGVVPVQQLTFACPGVVLIIPAFYIA